MADGYEFGWDDTIEKDSQEFVLLAEGDYDFTVTKFERGRHNGSEKLPACNKAIVSISIDSPFGATVIQHQLFLHSKTEGLLSDFFIGIGQKKKGEKLKMNWNAVVGAKGRCKVYVDTWKNKNGEDVQSNRIRKFYAPEETADPAKDFVPGRF